jgi:hypothetical protein
MRKDGVTPEMREYILKRDGMCFVFYVQRGAHVCRNQAGVPHSPFALGEMTIDHFWHIPGGVKGKRAPSGPSNLTAMCYWANVVTKPSREIRQAQREYTDRVEGGTA